MKEPLVIGISLAVLLVSGWADREAKTRKESAETQAKARANADRKAMNALPSAFQTPDDFTMNEPQKRPERVSVESSPKI
jgi:hypothetical protein